MPAPAIRGQEAPSFLRGDADGSGRREITDAIIILNFLFSGGRAPVCEAGGDVTSDGLINLTDAINLLGHLFLGNPAPGELTEEEALECRGIDPAAVDRGRTLYEQRDEQGNDFTCALCHSMTPDAELDSIRPGHSLHDVLGRPAYKAGAFEGAGTENLLSAVNVCLDDWMVAPKWEADDPRFDDLLAFLRANTSEAPAPRLEIQIVPPAVTGAVLETADPQAGCELFNRSCVSCHGPNAEGSFLAPSLVDVAFDCLAIGDEFCLDRPDYIRYRIRLSGPDHPGNVYTPPEGFQFAGSVMPFWTLDKLSDAQVEDITAFIIQARVDARAGSALTCDGGTIGDGVAVREGEFQGRFHGVAGRALELDTRRIRLEDFNYDGGGIVVKIWLYKAGAIRDGVAIGPDLFRPGSPYLDQTIEVDIPAEIPSESFDSVSIWCVSARQDFGSARLLPVTP